MKPAIEIFKESITVVRQYIVNMEPSDLSSVALELTKVELARLQFEESMKLQKESYGRLPTP